MNFWSTSETPPRTNGRIDHTTLHDWVAPLVGDKVRIHRMIGEMIRCLFCALVGKGRDQMATLVHLEPGRHFRLSFD